MNIKFKTLKLNNFMSFDEGEVNLQNASYTLVSGVNNNPSDLAKSNGSGKSSIWESIVWCLTGQTIRGTKDVINQNTTGGTSVELNFDIDKDTYKVIRYKEHKEFGTNLKVYINGEDKSGKGIRDTEKLLEQYLPDINANLLGSVIILGQGLPQRFTNNTPAGRKEVLEKLSKSDFMINDIKDKLSKRKAFLNEELRKYEDLILSDESKKSAFLSQLNLYENNFNNLQPLNWSELINKLNEETEQIKINYTEITNNINKDNENLSSLNINKVNLESSMSQFKLDLNEEFKLKMEPINNQILEYKVNLNNVNKKIEEYKNVIDICPTCGQKLPNVVKMDTTELEEESYRLQDNINTLNESIVELRTERIKREEEFNKSIIEKKQLLENEITDLKNKIQENINLSNTLNNQINTNIIQLNKYKEDEKNFENKKKEIEESIIFTKNTIEEVSQKILYNTIERDNIKVRQDVVNKMLSIAIRDFRGFLLSEVIKFINNKGKEYSKEIFETEDLEFKLDGNNIYIGYCNKQYENLSGGEKQKVDLIVQFSIRDMLTQFLDFSSNILVLDEIFDNLDSIGCQKVIDLISNKLTDIESIFIITHHADELSIPYDNEIVIIKDEKGISRIQ